MVEMAAKRQISRRKFLGKAAKNTAIVGGTFVLGGTASVLLRKRAKSNRVKYLAERKAFGVSIKSKLPYLKNHENWINLCQTCNWIPEKLPVKKIQLLEAVHNTTNISIKKIAYTIAENPDFNTKGWQAMLTAQKNNLTREIANSKKRGLPGRNAKKQLPIIRSEIARINRVLSIFNELSRNRALAKELGKEFSAVKDDLKALALEK